MNDTIKSNNGSKQAIAEADIVIAAYVLFLRRRPENKNVIAEKVRGGVENIAHLLINSVEFDYRITKSLEVIKAPPHGVLTLEGWRSQLIQASEPMTLSIRVVDALKNAISWDQIDHAILTDESRWRGNARSRISPVKRLWLAGMASAHNGLEGSLDVISAETVAGWCRDLARPSHRLSVNVYADNAFIGSVRCDEFRRDLLEQKLSDGRYGFYFKLPISARAHFNVDRHLVVRESVSGRVLGTGIVAAHTNTMRRSVVQKIANELIEIKQIVLDIERKMPQFYTDIGYKIDDFTQYYQQCIFPLQIRMKAHGEPNHANSFAVHVYVIVDVADPSLIHGTLRSLAQQKALGLKVTLIQIGMLVDDIVGRIKDMFTGHGASDALDLDVTSVPDEQSAESLILEQASGFGAVMFAGDVLSPNTFDLLMDAAQGEAASVFYFDDDVVTDEGRHIEPRLKPAFDFDFSVAEHYIGSFFIWNAELARAALAALPMEPDMESRSVEEWLYAVLLRIAVKGGDRSCRHIPWIMHHRRSINRPAIPKSLMLRHALPVLKSIGASAILQGMEGKNHLGGAHDKAAEGVIQIDWRTGKVSSVTVIIPTKDEVDLLRECIVSLRRAREGYAGEVEILIVDNMSAESETQQFLDALELEGVARTLRYHGAFNWAAANNLAAELSRGDVLICLNNDTKILSEGWLEELVSQALRPDVGAVGAKLVYADGTVQHGGVIVGFHGAAGHDGVGLHSTAPGYLNHLAVQRNVSAVTGACLATRKEVWRAIGGFDEINFPIAFNDTDYCMRVRDSGLKVIYTPFALAFHYESKSRGLDLDGRKDEEAVRRFKEKWRGRLDDPFYNKHFDRFAEPYALLTPRFAPGTEPPE